MNQPANLSRGEASSERRREPRWPCRYDVAIMPVTAESGFTEAQVVDFSDHGLGLSIREPLRVGEQILVKVRLQEHPALLIYTVQSCVSDAAGFRAGACFAGAITSPQHEDEQAMRQAFISQLESAARSSA